MSKEKRERDAEILRRMLAEDDGDTGSTGPSEPADRNDGMKRSLSVDDTVRCPKCGCVLQDRNGCPKCGYRGYIPLSDREIGKIRLILFPILLVIALVVYFLLRGGACAA